MRLSALEGQPNTNVEHTRRSARITHSQFLHSMIRKE
jgi:hypothetical protein